MYIYPPLFSHSDHHSALSRAPCAIQYVLIVVVQSLSHIWLWPHGLQYASLWLCGSPQTMENSSRDGNIRRLYLPPEKSVCSQEATVRTRHGANDWFQIRKGVCQGCILSPCLFNFYAEYIRRNARLDETQAEIKIAREISIISDMQMTTSLWQKTKKN